MITNNIGKEESSEKLYDSRLLLDTWVTDEGVTITHFYMDGELDNIVNELVKEAKHNKNLSDVLKHAAQTLCKHDEDNNYSNSKPTYVPKKSWIKRLFCHHKWEWTQRTTENYFFTFGHCTKCGEFYSRCLPRKVNR